MLQSTVVKSNKTEHTLQDRGTLLDEVVEHNKDLKLTLEMEDKRTRESAEIEETKKEMSQAREGLAQKDKAITKKLKEQNILRESTEKSLARMKKQYNEAIKWFAATSTLIKLTRRSRTAILIFLNSARITWYTTKPNSNDGYSHLRTLVHPRHP